MIPLVANSHVAIAALRRRFGEVRNGAMPANRTPNLPLQPLSATLPR